MKNLNFIIRRSKNIGSNSYYNRGFNSRKTKILN